MLDHGKPPPADEAIIREAAGLAMRYFLEPDLHNGGLVRDSARPGAPCSVAAAGFACAAFVAAERLGLVDRETALRHCGDVARVFAELPVDVPTAEAKDSAGWRGMFYHFLAGDGERRGRRTWKSEVSTIDTALLIAGLLVARGHFDRDDEAELTLRANSDRVIAGVDWRAFIRPSGRFSHGWRPEPIRRAMRDHDRDGFIVHEWDGYSEGLLLYLIAAASPRQDVGREAYDAWCSTYAKDWHDVEGIEHLHCPPLFTHQFPHAFIDLDGVADTFLRDRGLCYFENARRGTRAQIAYAKRNPLGHPGYGASTWGLSASNGPGIDHHKHLTRGGRRVRFHGYVERGLGPPAGVVDDGTLAPWATAASLPFLPGEVCDGLRAHRDVTLCRPGWHGFMGSYNLAYIDPDCPHGWVDEFDLAIEQAPIVMMAANYLDGGVWNVTRQLPELREALLTCGLSGGWLS
ncbi:MAG: glucoamylase family protein [Planctomycetota bacterium]